jgi:hypothetical protein
MHTDIVGRLLGVRQIKRPPILFSLHRWRSCRFYAQFINMNRRNWFAVVLAGAFFERRRSIVPILASGIGKNEKVGQRSIIDQSTGSDRQNGCF